MHDDNRGISSQLPNPYSFKRVAIVDLRWMSCIEVHIHSLPSSVQARETQFPKPSPRQKKNSQKDFGLN
jgi:hypothetical protein